ncbi:MAG TPA: penicillin-binding protein 2 [Acidimicrobiales bacterium]|nr:penicillin-binding protein 2 [Acidimicrobiales bacterium]
MNKQIRRLGIGLLACYVALFVQLNILQVVRADSYNANPLNTRQVVRDFSRPRGLIQTADGVILAQSVPSNDRYNYQRVYPTKDLFAGVTGFFAFNFGSDGVERSYNDVLAGRTDSQRVFSWNSFFEDQITTADVTLSLRSDAQTTAKEQLGDRQGSVVALDPRDGAILAMWSFPSYDPNLLATHDFAKADTARKFLLQAPGKPLVPATYRERYFPGSTFKVVTASAGLQSGQVTPTSPVYPPAESYTPPLTTNPIENFGGEVCGGTLFNILAVSCNSAFAQMGVDLGPEVMVGQAEAEGFNAKPPIDLPAPAASFFPPVAFFDHNTPALAQAAIGQNDVQASALQMALVAAGVANGGVIEQPHVMQEVRNSDGDVIDKGVARFWRRPLSVANAAIMRDAMVNVVQHGTATRMQIPGVLVAGKTGTAQLGSDPPRSHAWIIGFAPADNPRVAVAVVVLDQSGATESTGGRVAAPIAKAVMQTILAAPDRLSTGQ